MSKTVVSVENLAKQYRLGSIRKADTLVKKVKNMALAPYYNFQRIRSLTRFDSSEASTFWALQDICFEVKEGEVLGIIGHNGAGKSTLLKILSRITTPTNGKIILNGRVSALLEVGTGFHQELTGRENIYMNGTILGMRKTEIDHKLDQIIDFSGIHDHIDTPVKFYSSGMTVRLAFSVAAHLEPEILIIDEVLAVGDAEFQRKCLGKMDEVAKDGRTVLFVSHNMSAIQNLCTRALLLKKGRKIFEGNPLETIDNYLKSTFSRDIQLNIGDFRVRSKGSIFIKSIILNGETNRLLVLNRKGKIKVQLLIQSDIEVKGVLITIRIKSRDRSIIFHSNSMDQKKNYDLNTGQNEIEVQLGQDLMPGEYLMDFGLNAGIRTKSFDALVDIPCLEIENLGEYAIHFFSDRPGYVYNQDVIWK
jgi:lipopolysaccharide transport system ATP-binding protein